MKNQLIRRSFWLFGILFFIHPVFAQTDCKPNAKGIYGIENNCDPCVNHMEKLLRPLLQKEYADQAMQGLNNMIRRQLKQEQDMINKFFNQQNQTDRVLKEWHINALSDPPAITEIEYLQNTIDDMRAFTKRFPEQTDWINHWIRQFEENITVLKKIETLKSKSAALTNKIKQGGFGDLSHLDFNCCLKNETEGSTVPDPLAHLTDLENELDDLYHAYYTYRSELSDLMINMIKYLENMLSQRAKEEKKAIDRRDAYANGLSGFFVAKMQSALSTGIQQLFQEKGYYVSTPVSNSLESLSIALSQGLGAMGSGGGLAGMSGDAIEILINQTISGLSENDRRALAFVSNGVLREIATAAIKKVLQDNFTSALGSYLMKGADAAAEGLAIPLMLFDRLMTIAPYLWEDKNRMILQGGFDRILLGLVKSIRLSLHTSVFNPSDPLQAYFEALKGDRNQSVKICLPEQTPQPRTLQEMKTAFLNAAFPNQAVEKLSSNDQYQTTSLNGINYLQFSPDSKIRFLVRFDCYCGVKAEKISQPPPTTEGPWSGLSITDPSMKIFNAFLLPEKNGFPYIPVISGVVGTGALLFLLKKDKEEDCSFTAIAQSTPSSCGQSNGRVTITTNVNATYLWSNGSTTQNLQGVPAGTYSVTITKVGTSCTRVLQVTVTNVDIFFTTSIITTDASCGQSNGTAIVSTDPPGTYSYLWNNGSSTQNQNNLGPGTYTLTVTSQGTCQDISTITIQSLPPEFDFELIPEPASCGMSDGSVTTFITPPADYNFNWSDGTTQAQLNGVTAGVYSLTVTLAGTSCEVTKEVEVEELPPSFTLTVVSVPAHCAKQDGSAEVTVDPGGEYTIDWSDGQSTAQATNLAPGTYTVTVTLTGTTCAKNAEVTIDELPPSFTLTTTASPSTCGASDGSATVTADPPDQYSYLWPDGQTTAQATMLSAGTYSVTVTIMGTSCSKSISVTISELPSNITVTTTTTPSGCGQPTGTATATGNPPAAYNYLWSDGQMGPQATNLAPGQYVVSVSLPGSTCITTDTVVIEQITPSFTGTVTSFPADCGLDNGSASITLDPDGAYTITWSNQQTGDTLKNVPAGMYQVTVTDENGCTGMYSTDIPENDPAYITLTGSMPATCIGGGEITIGLNTPGTGMLQLDIVSPEGTTSLSLTPGNYTLSSFINIIPGVYTLTVFDSNIGPSCTDSLIVTIGDQTPALNVVNDFYTTTAPQPVMDNMLTNDTGLNLGVTNVSNIIGGMVVFDEDGGFTYTPDPSFSGEGSFIYTVTDACGNTSTGVVTITVEMVPCDFTLSNTTIPAHCGLDDGSISVEVNEPGTYTYDWETGASGPDLTDVPAGFYVVTIEEVNLGCSLEFELELTEYPAAYIENLVVTQPTCSSPGEISIDLTAPDPLDVLSVTVTHPNGTDVFDVDPGNILLSDYIVITPGMYTLEVTIGNGGPSCIDEISVVLTSPPALEIETVSVSPPSAPSATDGTATITATVPGAFPYTIYVDGLPTSTSFANTFTVGGMGVGMHTIHIEDANGCVSNILMVDIPFPDIILSFGVSLSNFTYDESNVEHAQITSDQVWGSSILTSLNYTLGRMPQSLRLTYTEILLREHHSITARWEMEHRSKLGSVEKKKYSLTVEGGMGIDSWGFGDKNHSSPFLSVQGSAEMKFGNTVHLRTEIGLRGWTVIEKPIWRITARFPCIR